MDLTSSSGYGQNIAVAKDDWETLIPVADKVLIMPDPPKTTTKSGIILPDSARVQVGRGRVIRVSYFIQQQYEAISAPDDARIKELDVVLFHFGGFMPEDFEKMTEGRILIPVGNIVAKIKKERSRATNRPDQRDRQSQSDDSGDNPTLSGVG